MTLVDYDDGSRLIQNVPMCHQGKTSTCAQACVTSLLNYYGFKVNYADVINETSNPSMSAGMSPEQIIWYLRRYNLQAKSFRGNLSNLKALIDRGWPTIVGFDDLKVQHVVLVVGYNDFREMLFYIDSM